ncbi:MAG: thymidine kinase [Candidatus Malihini olakiniferum]
MAQLYFYYSAMNAGKSTALLQSSHNYKEQGMRTLIFTAEIDNRDDIGLVSSRIGLSSPALVFNSQTDLFTVSLNKQYERPVHCILIDECQFLMRKQVSQLSDVVDELDIPVLCYGLRTDFQGELFSGSQHLLAWADKIIELKTVCFCGRKANRVLRIDAEGKTLREGDQVVIGGNERYISVCRKHHKSTLGITRV